MKNKEKLLKDLNHAKKIFDKYLLNKDFLYIYENKNDNLIEYFEMKCTANNFLHLTGIKTNITASNFYSALSNGKISLKDIDYKLNGTTRLKLEVFSRLPLLFNSSIQVCFQDDFFTLRLQVDIMLNKLPLNRKDIILGLKKIKKSNFFVPASILKEEPQKIGKNFSRVLCIMEKNRFDKKYSVIKYKVKDIDIDELLNEIICEKIDM